MATPTSEVSMSRLRNTAATALRTRSRRPVRSELRRRDLRGWMPPFRARSCHSFLRYRFTPENFSRHSAANPTADSMSRSTLSPLPDVSDSSAAAAATQHNATHHPPHTHIEKESS